MEKNLTRNTSYSGYGSLGYHKFDRHLARDLATTFNLLQNYECGELRPLLSNLKPDIGKLVLLHQDRQSH